MLQRLEKTEVVFDLEVCIADTVTGQDDLDLYRIAREVAGRIPARERVAVLEVLLVPRIRAHLARSRRQIFAWRPRDDDGGEVDTVEYIRPKDTATRAHELREVAVSWGDSYRVLGECTADDLAALATWYRGQAHGHIAQAECYDALRARMLAAEVDTVAELPDDVLDEVFS